LKICFWHDAEAGSIKQMICDYGILMKMGLWHPLNLSIFAKPEKQLKIGIAA